MATSCEPRASPAPSPLRSATLDAEQQQAISTAKALALMLARQKVQHEHAAMQRMLTHVHALTTETLDATSAEAVAVLARLQERLLQLRLRYAQEHETLDDDLQRTVEAATREMKHEEDRVECELRATVDGILASAAREDAKRARDAASAERAAKRQQVTEVYARAGRVLLAQDAPSAAAALEQAFGSSCSADEPAASPPLASAPAPPPPTPRAENPARARDDANAPPPLARVEAATEAAAVGDELDHDDDALTDGGLGGGADDGDHSAADQQRGRGFRSVTLFLRRLGRPRYFRIERGRDQPWNSDVHLFITLPL